VVGSDEITLLAMFLRFVKDGGRQGELVVNHGTLGGIKEIGGDVGQLWPGGARGERKNNPTALWRGVKNKGGREMRPGK